MGSFYSTDFMKLWLLHSHLNTPNPSLAISFVLLLTSLSSPNLGTLGSQINLPPLALQRLGMGQGISQRDTCDTGWGVFYFESLPSAFCFMTPDDRQNCFCTCRSTRKSLHWLENAFDEGLPTGSFRLSSAWISHSVHGTWLFCISLPPYCLGFLPLVKSCEWQFWISQKISNRRLVIFILVLPSGFQIKGIL